MKLLLVIVTLGIAVLGFPDANSLKSNGKKTGSKMTAFNKRVQRQKSKLPLAVQRALSKGSAGIQNLTAAVIAKLPAAVLANMSTGAMTRDKFRAANKKMGKKGTSRDDLNQYLSGMDQQHFNEFLSDVKNASRRLSKLQKEAIIKRKIRGRGKLSKWQAADVKQVGSKILGAMTPAQLRNLTRASKPTFDALMEELKKKNFKGLTKGQKKAIEKGVELNYGPPRTWSASAVKKFASVLRKKDITKLNASVIKESIDELGKQRFNRRTSRSICKKLKGNDGLGNVNTWTGQTLKKLGNLIDALPAKDINQLNNSAVREALPELGKHKYSKSKTRKLAKKVKDSQIQPLRNWDASTIGKVKNILPGLKPKDLKDLDAEQVAGSLEKINDVDFQPVQRKIIAKKCKAFFGNPSAWNETVLRKLQSIIFGLPEEDIEKIPASSITKEILRKLKPGAGTSQSKKRAVLKKVKSKGDFRVKDNKELLPELTLEDLASSDPVLDLGLCNETDDGVDLPTNIKQSSKLLERIKKDWGPPDNWSLAQFSCLGSLLKGMTNSEIKNLSKADGVADRIEGFASQVKHLTDGQKKAVMEARKESEGMPLDDATIASYGPLTAELEDEDLEDPTAEVAAEAVRQTGMAELHKKPRKTIRKLFKRCLKLLGKARGLTRELKISELTSDDIDDLGNTMVGIEPSEIDQLKKEEVKDAADSLGNIKGLSIEQKKRCFKKYKEAIRGSSTNADAASQMTNDDVVSLGGLLEGAETTDIEKFPKDVVKDNIDIFGERQFNPKQAKTLTKKLDEQPARQRRAISSKTGEELISMGNMLVGLTTQEIADITTQSYDEAADAIGRIQGFNQEQLKAWAAKAKQAWNSDPSRFTSEQLLKLGVVATAFTSEELGSMALSSNEVIESLGSQRLYSSADSPGYTSSQLLSAYKQIKKLKNKVISAFTGNEIVALKNFSLAMTPEEIQSINAIAFGAAAGSLGSLSGWSKDQMIKLKERSIAVYGSVNTWTVAELRDVGAAIGGLTTAELQGLSADHVSMISPSTISKIPASLFAEFTKSQLQALDSGQATAVTSEQMDALPLEKRNVLNEKRGEEDEVDKSGARQVRLSPLFILFIPTLFYL